MNFNAWRLIQALFPNRKLERAVRQGDEQAVREALAAGANPNLRLSHNEPLSYITVAMGAWRLVDDGDILSLAMHLGHERIGLILADAGASVPSVYQERIVSQRWHARLIAQSQGARA